MGQGSELELRRAKSAYREVPVNCLSSAWETEDRSGQAEPRAKDAAHGI
eukprot:gene20664-27452_t